MNVLRIQNRAVLTQPVFLELIGRAFAAREDLYPKPDEVLDWFIKNLGDPLIGIFVAVDDTSNLGGLLVGSLRTSVFSKLPWLLYVYAEHWKMTEALCEACREWSLEHGYDKFYAFDTTPNKTFLRRVVENLNCEVPSLVHLTRKDDTEKERT
jgi:hypothetical protein